MTLGETPDFDRNTVIFKTVPVSEHLYDVNEEKIKTLLEGWRVLPFPKLQSDSEQGVVSMQYAFVNPYSQQQDAAVEYLEVIAANQSRIVRTPVFFREDIEYYENLYDTSMPAFQDLYEIFRNSAMDCNFSWDLHDEYITDYQRGLITMDEAIELRQKRALAGLYE